MKKCQLCLESTRTKAPTENTHALGLNLNWGTTWGTTRTGINGKTISAELCRHCIVRLPWIRNACKRCGSLQQAPESPCAICQKQAVIRDETISAFTYSFPVDSLIQQYKYQQRLPLLNTLSWAVADALAQQSGTRTNIDGLVPVPLHRKKLQQRGFNQCHWLAKRLSNCLEIPLLADLCERHVHAPAQSQQSGTARRSNMDRAFRLTRGLSTQTKHLAIVDDVITTGATVEAIAAQLKRAGASTVSVWTIATAFG